MKNYMPEESLYMLRYHSFYSAHRHGAYRHLMSDHDIEMLEWVNKFNVYDLYSKGHTKPNVAELKPYNLLSSDASGAQFLVCDKY
jgi:inositol oxygenase